MLSNKLCQEKITKNITAHPVGIIPQNVTQHNKLSSPLLKAVKSGGKPLALDRGNVIWYRFVGRGVLGNG